MARGKAAVAGTSEARQEREREMQYERNRAGRYMVRKAFDGCFCAHEGGNHKIERGTILHLEDGMTEGWYLARDERGRVVGSFTQKTILDYLERAENEEMGL